MKEFKTYMGDNLIQKLIQKFSEIFPIQIDSPLQDHRKRRAG
jgi:hypothetical protein